MHYEIDYNNLMGPKKAKKALADLKDYLGKERYRKIIEGFRLDFPNGMAYGQFAMAASFAGVHGYPVKIWFRQVFPVTITKDEYRLFLRGTRWEMDHEDIRRYIGAPSPLPADFTWKGEIQGVEIRVVPSRMNKKHRTFATCPWCGIEFTCGNIHQHVRMMHLEGHSVRNGGTRSRS